MVNLRILLGAYNSETRANIEKPLNLKLIKYYVLQVDAHFKHHSSVSFQMLIRQKNEYCNTPFAHVLRVNQIINIL